MIGYSLLDTTDMSGYFSFDSLSAGNYGSVSFNHEDYQPVTISNVSVFPADTTFLNVEMIQLQGLLSGDIVDTSGVAIESVLVELDDGISLIDSAYSDSGGHFEFLIDAGSYNCTLSHRDYYGITISDTAVTPGDTTYLNLVMTPLPGILEGTVTDLASDTVAGVIVELTGYSLWDTTDTFGHYQFDSLAVGAYDVLFTHDEYIPLTAFDIPITPGDTALLNVVLEKYPGYLIGYVTDNSLVPIESLAVIVEADTMTLSGSGANNSMDIKKDYGVLLDFVDTVFTDINGYYEVALPEDVYLAHYIYQGCRDTIISGLVIISQDTIQVDVISQCGCSYIVGDVNGSDSYNGLDVTFGVSFFKGGAEPLCGECPVCPDWWYCGDVNGSCTYNGLDITYGVSYFKGGAGPNPCEDCAPLGGVTINSAAGDR